MMFLMYLKMIGGTFVFSVTTIFGSVFLYDFFNNDCNFAPEFAVMFTLSFVVTYGILMILWTIKMDAKCKKIKAYKKIYKKGWKEAYKQDLLNLERVKVNAEIQELAKRCNVNPEMLQDYDSKQIRELKRLLNIY